MTIPKSESVSKGWVNWPMPCDLCKGIPSLSNHDAWHNTGENGMAAWLLIRFKKEDDVCCPSGLIEFGHYPVNLDSIKEDSLPENSPLRSGPYYASAAILIGSTLVALYNAVRGEYFAVSKDDLTKEGKELFDTLTKLFGREPEIVTDLDT